MPSVALHKDIFVKRLNPKLDDSYIKGFEKAENILINGIRPRRYSDVLYAVRFPVSVRDAEKLYLPLFFNCGKAISMSIFSSMVLRASLITDSASSGPTVDVTPVILFWLQKMQSFGHPL